MLGARLCGAAAIYAGSKIESPTTMNGYPTVTVPGRHALAGERGFDAPYHDAQHARERCERRSLDGGALLVYEYTMVHLAHRCERWAGLRAGEVGA